jgi:hypothetical protein
VLAMLGVEKMHRLGAVGDERVVAPERKQLALGLLGVQEGMLEVGEEIASAKVAYIDANEEQRDAHSRSADFGDANHYPEIRFESTRIEPIDDGAGSSPFERARRRPHGRS